ncbi:hypothetical protein [Oryza sativa Japonica Group]|uniref:Uncharacterized protein n=1 Tax=Oryza sativa subsp. japonica TaxID=39947 RepID=Q5NAL6_ORYSJ|nr:hypothetical protein [Oryza sativa Japonica Group]
MRNTSQLHKTIGYFSGVTQIILHEAKSLHESMRQNIAYLVFCSRRPAARLRPASCSRAAVASPAPACSLRRRWPAAAPARLLALAAPRASACCPAGARSAAPLVVTSPPRRSPLAPPHGELTALAARALGLGIGELGIWALGLDCWGLDVACGPATYSLGVSPLWLPN